MDQYQNRNYSTSGQFTFLGRYRPNSLQVVTMDRHQRRNYSTSEQFTFLGRYQPLQVVNRDQHQHRNYVTSDQFTFLGRNFNPENISLAQARGNLMRSETHSHYHSNPASWSNVHHASNFSSELPCLGQTSSGPSSVAPHHFVGYDRDTHGIDTETVAGRSCFKRKSPDVPTVFDRGNSNQGPFEGSSSMPGLLDRQFDDSQHISQYSTSFQQYSSGNNPNILSNSGRNVRSRSGPNSVPTPVTSQHFHATNVPENLSVATHNPHTNADASAAWNFNFASSHVPGRTVSETNGASSQGNQFMVGRHGVEAGQYSYNAITRRNVVPPSQYLEVYGNSIPPQTNPTRTWDSTSLSYREHTRRVGDGYEATSNYHLQLPTETYYFRYSWSPSTQMWTSYQNDRARGAIDRYSSHATIDRNDRAPQNGFRARFRLRARYGYEATSSDSRLQSPAEVYSSRYSNSYNTATGHTIYQSDRDRSTHEHFLSLEPAMNRNGSMETQQHVIQDDLLTYFPRPRDTDVTQDGMFTYFPRPRDTDVIHDDLFAYISRPRDTDMIRDNRFTYFPRPRDTDVMQDNMFTYFPRPRDTDMVQDDMFTYFPRPRDTDEYDQYEDMRLDIDSMSYEELLALGEHIGFVKTGLTEDEMPNCLVESWNSASEQNKDKTICPICLDESNMDKVMMLSGCGHEFHLQCITKWLEMKTVCPMCKRSVTSDS